MPQRNEDQLLEDEQSYNLQEIKGHRYSENKVLSCAFSSDGTLLAVAGDDKQVCIWRWDCNRPTYSIECHLLPITDIRFRTNSTIFVTSSFDKMLKIWDAVKPTKALSKLSGHADPVFALDFHPRNLDILCSCSMDDEIRLWDVDTGACVNVFKGATTKVRYQPQREHLLATAIGNNINVINTEKPNEVLHFFEGHEKDVQCLCWDSSRYYIGSVSEDSARIWSLVLRECAHVLKGNGNEFKSCTFHHTDSLLLIIGCCKHFVLWNPRRSSKTMNVAAHDGIIHALVTSEENKMVASASHDGWVKLWN